MHRRKFLSLVGGGAVLAAAGATGFAMTRTPTKAIAPWQMAGAYDDPRLRALSHAILAPNPHNLQPWKVALQGDDSVTLFFDQDRQLPHTDPLDRQLTIGLGCFLELLRMAAAADGFRAEITLFPEGFSAEGLDARPVAHIRLTEDAAQVDPLWPHVPQRRSNKEPYDTGRPIPADALAQILATALTSQAGGTVAPEEVAYWREVTEEALHIELTTPRTYKESVELFRIGKREINATPDGIDLGGVMIESLNAAGLFTRETALDTNSMGFSAGYDAVMENCRTGMGYLWLVTQGNARPDQIAAGADWLRINLACTALGLGFQPMSQALQEYPEMSQIYQATHAKLAPSGGTVQMLSRIGYGPAAMASPRWPIDTKLVTI